MMPASVQAEQISYGNLIVNDIFGDGEDRWRSGSIVASHIFGQEWEGARPDAFGDIIELRIMGQIMAPSNLESPSPSDRPYAGALSAGVHTHFERSGFDVSLGADLTLVGPSTQLDRLQTELHDAVGIAAPPQSLLDAQIGNTVRLTGVAEVGYNLDLGTNARLTPFAEVRAGDETLVRAGFDFVLGEFGRDELLVRDPVSGQRYQASYQNRKGWSFLAGADVAYVDSSVYLPASSGVTLEDTRTRVRLGLNWQGERSSVYYGASWLSEEFTAQPEGQIVGAIRVRFNF